MMRVSDGDFGQQIILRTAPDFGVTGDEVNKSINYWCYLVQVRLLSLLLDCGSRWSSISELRIANPVGTFTDGERVTGNSTTRDVSVGFTVRGIVSDATVTNDGILYSNNESLTVESLLVINQ